MEGCPGNSKIASDSVTHAPGPQMEHPSDGISGHCAIALRDKINNDDVKETILQKNIMILLLFYRRRLFFDNI